MNKQTTSENDFKLAISLLLMKYKQLNTTEIKNKITQVIKLTKNDQKPANSRKEPLYIQRIGNIVSHMGKNVKVKKIYNYQIVKGKGHKDPAVFTLLTNKGKKRKAVQKSKIQSTKMNFTPIKIDWSKSNKSKSKLGLSGEKFVLDMEIQNQQDPNDKKSVKHISKILGDGAGYDIMSLDNNGDPLCIEVKTTTKGKDEPFYMSKNEEEFFRLNTNSTNVVLYRVYDFDKKSKKGKIFKIYPKDLFNDYDFTSYIYKVYKK